MRTLSFSIAFLTVLAIALAGFVLPLGRANAKAPEITYMFPEDGDTVAEALTVIQMCFAEPIDVRDKQDGGQWDFSLTAPGNRGLGMRIVFQPDGYGAAIYPGLIDDDGQGTWTFTFRIADRQTGEETKETTSYDVGEGGIPPLEAPPPMCTSSGPSAPATTPAASSPEPTPANSLDGRDDDGLGVLELALITVGVAAGVLLLAVIGYGIRNRVGFWLHRPPPRDDGNGDGHH